MEKTAIEWLIEKLNNYDSKMIELFEKEISQAKEMGKEQIIDFTNKFIEKHTFGDYDGIVQRNKTIEQYYSQTFKQD